jgi:hypothetical protein
MTKWIQFSCVFLFCGLTTGILRAQAPLPLSVTKAEMWSRLLNRQSGWTGADGIFAIPLSGYEGPDHSAQGKTLFLFSDTFIGQVDSTGARKNIRMVNNTLAILDGSQPDSSKIRFIWGKDSSGGAKSVFVPSTPTTAGKDNWYWLEDGFCHKQNVYILALLESPNPSGPAGFKFQTAGVAMIKIPIGTNGEPDLAKHMQMDLPLFSHVGTKTIEYGSGLMPNTVEAGAIKPDGYLYVYGSPALYVARISVDSIEDSTQWRFWDGKTWSKDINLSVSLGDGGSELSVTPVAEGSLKGKYLMVSMGLSDNIFIRVGDSPIGPFTTRTNIYKAPEWSAADSIYTYNAKAHPSLSSNGDWLITYNVNSTSWNRNLRQADIYRPRFLSIRFDPVSGIWMGADKERISLRQPFLASKAMMGLDWHGAEKRLDGRDLSAREIVPGPLLAP